MVERDTLLLGRHKGLLILKQQAGEGKVVQEACTGFPISYTMIDPRTRTLWTGVDHGHFD